MVVLDGGGVLYERGTPEVACITPYQVGGGAHVLDPVLLRLVGRVEAPEVGEIVEGNRGDRCLDGRLRDPRRRHCTHPGTWLVFRFAYSRGTNFIRPFILVVLV